jgi:hypothetical protein
MFSKDGRTSIFSISVLKKLLKLVGNSYLKIKPSLVEVWAGTVPVCVYRG